MWSKQVSKELSQQFPTPIWCSEHKAQPLTIGMSGSSQRSLWVHATRGGVAGQGVAGAQFFSSPHWYLTNPGLLTEVSHCNIVSAPGTSGSCKTRGETGNLCLTLPASPALLQMSVKLGELLASSSMASICFYAWRLYSSTAAHL